MTVFLTIIRILTAIIAPLVTIALATLITVLTNRDQGNPSQEAQKCLRCDQSRKGAEGKFHYTESIGSPRQRAAKMQLNLENTPILGAETHFVCNHCAHRYIRNEVIQQVLMALPYPLYLYVFIPFVTGNTLPGNFLVETLLLVMSVAGVTSAYDLYRAVRAGKSSLTEARDRVAIKERKSELGKKFSYYTRAGTTHLGK